MMTVMMKLVPFLYLVLAICQGRDPSAFAFAPSASFTNRQCGQVFHGSDMPLMKEGMLSFTKKSVLFSTSPESSGQDSEEAELETDSQTIVTTKDLVQKVAVAGATGRTGRLVVQELLNREVPVVALVRSMDKAREVLGDDDNDGIFSPLLTVSECDLTSEGAIKEAVQGCDGSIWCATGFSNAPLKGIFNKLKRFVGIVLTPQQSIDMVGIPLLASSIDSPSSSSSSNLPKVVMLSSAGVTRPSWDEDKKERLEGCADIPIVRLNPFGILDIKAESEDNLRKSGVPYSIVRPTGLNDDWPEGSRPIVSQGDVAVGRMNRQDVATVLVDVLTMPEACGKTFEVVGLAGYSPPSMGLSTAIGRLQLDADGALSEAQVEANFRLLQQLLPGETQQAAQLAMGQTYEQLDKDQEGRLGPRGQENAEAAAPQPTNQ